MMSAVVVESAMAREGAGPGSCSEAASRGRAVYTARVLGLRVCLCSAGPGRDVATADIALAPLCRLWRICPPTAVTISPPPIPVIKDVAITLHAVVAGMLQSGMLVVHH